MDEIKNIKELFHLNKKLYSAFFKQLKISELEFHVAFVLFFKPFRVYGLFVLKLK
jgi:hypothetical protein